MALSIIKKALALCLFRRNWSKNPSTSENLLILHTTLCSYILKQHGSLEVWEPKYIRNQKDPGMSSMSVAAIRPLLRLTLHSYTIFVWHECYGISIYWWYNRQSSTVVILVPGWIKFLSNTNRTYAISKSISSVMVKYIFVHIWSFLSYEGILLVH